jgi:hypothetical protein
MPIAPGTRLGPYDLIAPLGAVAMGDVWRARDAKLDRDIVTPSPDGQKFYACVANQTYSRGLIRLARNWAKGLAEAK